MSFAALSSGLWDILSVPSARIPIDFSIFVSYILPTLLSYFVGAVLAITPRTRVLRVACFPVVAVLAFRAAVSVDLACSKPEFALHNLDLVISMICITAQALHWALAKEPLVRHIRPANATPSTIMDAIDLTLNLRGYGWNWARGLDVPRETRPSDRTGFVAYAILASAANAFLSGIFHTAVQAFSPTGIGSISGGSIFDNTLPFLARFIRASIISAAVGCSIYTSFQMTCHLVIVPAILVFGQDPAQWPPAFDAPWRATSLSEFWGRRWHQLFRHTFLVFGGYPLSFVLGRSGFVIGAFLASAVFHNISLLTLHGEVDAWRMPLSFGMMALGVLAERAFFKVTSKKVGGLAGWVWMAIWFALWGNLIVDAWARAGIFGFPSPIVEGVKPVQELVEGLVTGFDAWLHARVFCSEKTLLFTLDDPRCFLV